MQVQSPRWDDLLEEGMATHSAHEDKEDSVAAVMELWRGVTSEAAEQAHTDLYRGNCYLLTSRFYPQTISGFSIAADDILIKESLIISSLSKSN